MWCQNKSEQGSDTCYYNIARTKYYYSQNKFVCHLEQKMSEQIRIIVRTKSYYSQNNFMCHLEQKQMYYQNKSEQGVRTSLSVF
jgi:hypothetical protein